MITMAMGTALMALTTVVGMIDYGTPTAPDGMEVRMLTSNPHTEGYRHGSQVLRQMARMLPEGQRIKVVYANPFLADARGENHIVVDWAVAKQALVMMRKAGVTHVCTTFTTEDEANAREFKATADELGLTIVASLGNGELDAPYPAMLPGVVAVLANEEVSKVGEGVRRRADHRLSGRLDKETVGSSFASARMCGRIATGR